MAWLLLAGVCDAGFVAAFALGLNESKTRLISALTMSYLRSSVLSYAGSIQDLFQEPRTEVGATAFKGRECPRSIVGRAGGIKTSLRVGLRVEISDRRLLPRLV